MREREIDIIKICEFERMRKYLLRYIDEIKQHFDVEQEELEQLVLDCYKTIRRKPLNKFISMVKSLGRFSL